MNKSAVTIATFNKMAQVYLEKFGEMEDYQDTFDIFCNAIEKENPSILELACGPGNITSYLIKKRPDFKILATDLAPNMLELGKKQLPDTEFKLMDCRKFRELKQQFDGIFCAFGLPYLTQEEAADLIKAAAVKLKNDGVLYLSTMIGDYSKSGPKGPSNGGPDITYTYYHDKGLIGKELYDAGFRIIHSETREFTNSNGEKATDFFVISNKV